MKVEGAVAIVTGGAQGFGKAFTEELLKRGAKVCFADINEELGRKTEQEIHKKNDKTRSFFVKCDVCKDADFQGLFDKAKERYGNVDILINNAGILNERDMNKTVEVNLMGCIRGTNLAIEHMRKDKGGKGGLVVNMSSISGLIPAFFMPAYSATKHGLVGYTKSWASNPMLGSKYGVSFACFCPAFSDTVMVTGTLNSEDPPLIDYTTNKDAIQALINSMGINTVEDVTKVLMELIEKDENNGCVVTLNAVHGAKYI